MSFESYKGGNLKLSSEMQVELARRFYGLPETASGEELDDVVLRWIEANDYSNSSKFRKLIEEHPELIELYKTDPENALRQIEEQIYEKETA